MASFFLLLTDYVVPDGDFEGFFAHYELQDKRGNVQPGGSSFWYQVRNSSSCHDGDSTTLNTNIIIRN